jgi:hypothetical protein
MVIPMINMPSVTKSSVCSPSSLGGVTVPFSIVPLLCSLLSSESAGSFVHMQASPWMMMEEEEEDGKIIPRFGGEKVE